MFLSSKHPQGEDGRKRQYAAFSKYRTFFKIMIWLFLPSSLLRKFANKRESWDNYTVNTRVFIAQMLQWKLGLFIVCPSIYPFIFSLVHSLIYSPIYDLSICPFIYLSFYPFIIPLPSGGILKYTAPHQYSSNRNPSACALLIRLRRILGFYF